MFGEVLNASLQPARCGQFYALHNLWGRIVLICTLQMRNLRPRQDEVTPQGKGMELGLCRPPLSHPGMGSEQVCPAGGSTPTVLATWPARIEKKKHAILDPSP